MGIIHTGDTLGAPEATQTPPPPSFYLPASGIYVFAGGKSQKTTPTSFPSLPPPFANQKRARKPSKSWLHLLGQRALFLALSYAIRALFSGFSLKFQTGALARCCPQPYGVYPFRQGNRGWGGMLLGGILGSVDRSLPFQCVSSRL